jgi:nucleoside-diphosphate-sugar epimerase
MDNLVTVIGRDSVANVVYVDDVVNAIILAMESGRADGEAFIINGDNEKISWREYVHAFSEGLGYPPELEQLEHNLALERVRKSFVMLSDSIHATKELLRSPEFLTLLTRIPLVVQIGLLLLKGRRRVEVESSITSVRKIQKPNPKILSKYEVLPKQVYSVLACKAVFSSAKARNLIGFTSTPFKNGIRSTLEWAKWANYSNMNSNK